MGQILSPLEYEDLSQGDQILWLRLIVDYRYSSNVLAARRSGSSALPEVAVIRAGFECDGESVPSFLYSLVPPFGAARKGAVAHDGLYTFAGYHRMDGSFQGVTRATADGVYRELLVACGVARWRAWVRWTVLRIAGGKAWRAHREEKSLTEGNEGNKEG